MGYKLNMTLSSVSILSHPHDRYEMNERNLCDTEYDEVFLWKCALGGAPANSSLSAVLIHKPLSLRVCGHGDATPRDDVPSDVVMTCSSFFVVVWWRKGEDSQNTMMMTSHQRPPFEVCVVCRSRSLSSNAKCPVSQELT